MLFVFVFSFPFAYVQLLGGWVVPTTFLLCFALYGVAHISRELENPLGWELSDLDLEGFKVASVV